MMLAFPACSGISARMRSEGIDRELEHRKLASHERSTARASRSMRIPARLWPPAGHMLKNGKHKNSAVTKL